MLKIQHICFDTRHSTRKQKQNLKCNLKNVKLIDVADDNLWEQSTRFRARENYIF